MVGSDTAAAWRLLVTTAADIDSTDNSAYIPRAAKHSARRSWIYVDGENFMGARVDVANDPDNPELNIAWKYLWTAKDTWLGSEQNLGAIGAAYNLTMDPFEKYDMTFNGAVAARLPQPSAGGNPQDNGWVLRDPPSPDRVRQIDHRVSEHQAVCWWCRTTVSISKYPDNPVPLLDVKKPPNTKALGD